MNLHDLLEDAVADVEPTDRIDAIRARTASPARTAARPWWWAAGATVVATAAAVCVVAIVDQDPPAPGHDQHGMVMDPPASSQLVAAYFVGDGPNGPRLFREFDEVPVGDPLQVALDRLQRSPRDPDYRSAWPAGSLESATVGDGTIDVELGDTLAMRMTDQLGVQQVVQTLQGALGRQLPVRFLQNGEDTIGAVSADPGVLNPVSISDPAEGNAYEGSMIARGRTSDDQVTWELRRPGGSVVKQGYLDLEPVDSGLSPWELTVDLADVAPGTYTFATAGGGSTDTRTIVVR